MHCNSVGKIKHGNLSQCVEKKQRFIFYYENWRRKMTNITFKKSTNINDIQVISVLFHNEKSQTSVLASSSSLDSDVLVEYEVSYLAYCNYCVGI